MSPEARAFAGDAIRPRSKPKPAHDAEPVDAAAEEAEVSAGSTTSSAEPSLPAPAEITESDAAPSNAEIEAAAGPGLAPDVEPSIEVSVEPALAPEVEPASAHAPRSGPHVVVVGGGITGAALAHDLAQRGVRVTLLERGDVASGSTGRHQGLLHSGARYATTDRAAAVECVAENKILRRIAPGSFEENDGLFVALTDQDADFEKQFIEACWQTAVPTRQIGRARALRLEPGLNPSLRLAVQVADATVDPLRLALRFLATARSNGARIRTFSEVVGLIVERRSVRGVKVRDYAAGSEEVIGADLVVNAAGPWAGQVAALAGAALPLTLEAGAMVALRGRLCNMVVNRLHEPGDADLIVPQRQQTLIGVSKWPVTGGDEGPIPEGRIGTLIEEAAALLPAVREASIRASWTSMRPLFDVTSARKGSGLPREIRCLDHATDKRPRDGLVTIAGGNATLARAMAEAAANLICRKLGVDRQCETGDLRLLPHAAWYAR